LIQKDEQTSSSDIEVSTKESVSKGIKRNLDDEKA
jgi:hypothetical protein